MKSFLGILFLFFAQTAVAQLTINDAGIWSEEGREGHGLIITTWPETGDLPSGANITWFTHTPSGDGQVWLFGDNLVEGNTTVDFYMPMGSFPAENYERGDPVGTFSIEKISQHEISLTFTHYLWTVGCVAGQPIVSPPPPNCNGVITFNRLTPRRD